MAEFVMKRLVADAGLGSQFQIDSAATSTEEIGNPVYPPARRKLAEHGINTVEEFTRVVRAQQAREQRQRMKSLADRRANP